MKQSLKAFSKLSDRNIIRVASLAEYLADDFNKPKVRFVKSLYEIQHPALQLTRRIMNEIDANCREKFIDNFILNELLENSQKREEAVNKGLPPLFSLLISPSMRCNLRCKGCYAQNYTKDDDLPFDDYDRVISEAEALGATMITILGGEPFFREDIFDVFARHPNAYFLVFFNGTLVDESIAKKLAEAGNVLVNFSVEGFEADNDFRRGDGVYKKVMRAMDVMREHRLPFGYSACVTRRNAATVVSDEFVNHMIKKGAILGWYFLYMPVCGDKNTDLMPTPAQRDNQRRRRDEIRETKPLFIIDFWNDAPYVGGCIAAKHYSHVNNYGDVEPCIFTHFSQANIKNTSLAEALTCPLFNEIRSRQPYDENLLMPCMLIDHPHVFREIQAKLDLKATHPGAATLVNELGTSLDEYSKGVRAIYDQVWHDTKHTYPKPYIWKKPAPAAPEKIRIEPLAEIKH